MPLSKLSLPLALVFTALLSHAMAQPAAELPPMPPPPPPPASPSQPAAAEPGSAEPPPATPASAQCVPSCRTGFLCHEGQCISACNPPCAAGQRCTANGECLAEPTSPPPLAFPVPAAESPAERAPNPGKERHDGLMLRTTIGFGTGDATEEQSGVASAVKSEFTGVSLSLSFDIGAALVEDLLLHGRLSYMEIVSPRLWVDGMDLGRAKNSSLAAILLGPAISYYFMPVNIYLTGAVGLSWLAMNNGNNNNTQGTKTGFGLNVDLGKEWWVNDDWGFGAAARFWYSHVPDSISGIDLKYNFFGWGLLFSVTYN